MLLERARAGQQRRVALGELADGLAEALRQRLAVLLRQLRLGVEQVDVAGPADHEQEDDPLGLGREVRLAARRAGSRPACRARPARSCRQQPGQGEAAAAAAGAEEEVAARGVRGGCMGASRGGGEVWVSIAARGAAGNADLPIGWCVSPVGNSASQRGRSGDRRSRRRSRQTPRQSDRPIWLLAGREPYLVHIPARIVGPSADGRARSNPASPMQMRSPSMFHRKGSHPADPDGAGLRLPAAARPPARRGRPPARDARPNSSGSASASRRPPAWRPSGSPAAGHEPSSSVVILLYVMRWAASSWAAPGQQDWLIHVSRSVLPRRPRWCSSPCNACTTPGRRRSAGRGATRRPASRPARIGRPT